MDSRYNSQFKTLGPRAAQLITELNERNRSTFALDDVIAITGLSPQAASNLVHKAVQRGLVTRLKPGLYNLVPFQLGRASEYVDNPCIIAQEIVRPNSYFISHGAALEIHRMVTQPVLTMHVSCTKRLRPQVVGGFPFRFIHITDTQFFGTTKHWVDKHRHVIVSDMERTIIDGLRHPSHVGGITEVGKGMWMKRQTLDVERLVEYAARLRAGVVFRRLGYLLERYEMANASTLGYLRSLLTNTYQRLDPLLPAEGQHLARWRLQLNVPPEEMDAVRLG